MSLHRLPDLIGKNGIFNDGDWVESKDQDPNGDVRLIQLADIGDGEYLDKSNRFLTSQKAEELRCTYIKPGDILIARMPDPLGRACIFPGNERPCVTVVDVCIVRVDREIVNPKWLLYKINSPKFRDKIDTFATGTTRKRISRKNLGKLEFGLPPLAEQQRISAVLDKADALRTKRRAALTKLDTLLQSTFLHLFGDPVTNPMGWPIRKVGDVVRIHGGYAFKSKDYVDYGVPLIRIGEVNRQDFDSENLVCLPNSFKQQLERFIVRGGTILMSLTGTTGKDDYGNAVILNGSHKEYFLNQRVAAIIPNPEYLLNDYLCYFLQNIGIKRQLTSVSRGIRQANISNSDIARLEIPIPEIEPQKTFEKIVKNIFEEIAKIKHMENQLDNLFHSLQQRAFKGEL